MRNTLLYERGEKAKAGSCTNSHFVQLFVVETVQLRIPWHRDIVFGFLLPKIAKWLK